jgi:Uma2 family endonuclease
MTPCGSRQALVVGSIAGLLDEWVEAHRDYTFGTNEAGMLLGGDVRAADAAVWMTTDVHGAADEYARVAPVLAIEVAGEDEGEAELRKKAHWYLEHGVRVVWLVIPEARAVLVMTGSEETRLGPAQTLPTQAELPGLAPRVERFFRRTGS